VLEMRGFLLWMTIMIELQLGLRIWGFETCSCHCPLDFIFNGQKTQIIYFKIVQV